MDNTIHLRLDYIKPNLENTKDYSVIDYVCNNPYRVFGLPCNASFSEILKVKDKITKLSKLGAHYYTSFDLSFIGESSRGVPDIQNAEINISDIIYKIFWYTDDSYIKDFGSEETFNEFFNPEKSISEIKYDCFLSNYLYLVVTDPKFDMILHWNYLFNYLSKIMEMANGNYWEIIAQSKSCPNEPVDSILLYETFVSNILLPVHKLAENINLSKNIKACLSLVKAIGNLANSQKPFMELKSSLFYFMEEWVQFKIEFIYDNFINGIVNNKYPTNKELKIIDAIISYYKEYMQEFFEDIIFKVIPIEHTANHRIRENFYNCFNYIAFTFYYGKLHEKSLDLLYMLRCYSPDDSTKSKIDNDINAIRLINIINY